MSDVARLAGVGTMTVSRLLSGSAGVSKKTANRIQRAIRALNYQPNELARSLRSVHSKTIALILPYLHDPFFATCAHAVSRVATENGYSVLITTSDNDPEIEERQARAMLRRQVEGLLVVPSPEANNYLALDEFARVHVVALDRPVEHAQFDSVVTDNRGGARRGVEHLIGHGHRRIAFLGLSQKLFTMQDRFAGYRDAMRESGLEPMGYVESDSPEKGLTGLDALLKAPEPPTALFAGNNMTMRHLLHALNALRIEVPARMALAGFDDFDIADVMRPALTVVRQPVLEIGETAARFLFERIEGRENQGTGKRMVLPADLVIRHSCGCAGEFDANGTMPQAETAELAC